MNIIIDLEDVYAPDDATLADTIRDTVMEEIKREVREWTRAAVMDEYKSLVDATTRLDWKKVAEALRALQ